MKKTGFFVTLLGAAAIALAACSGSPTLPFSSAPQSGGLHEDKVVVNQPGSAVVTGSINSFISGGFLLNAGTGVGQVTVYKTASTVIAGPPLTVGEKVEVDGSGNPYTTVTATRVAQIVTVPSTLLPHAGTITSVGTNTFTIRTSTNAIITVNTSSSTTMLGAAPANGLYAQTLGTGSGTTETATFVSVTASAPSAVTTSGTIVKATAYGMTLNVDSSHTAVPVAISASTTGVPYPIAAGDTATVSGKGSIGQALVAGSVSVPTPAPTPNPSPGTTMLENTTGQFSAIQILDRKMTPAQVLNEAPKEDVVWGAFDPADWNTGHPGMYVSRYMIPMNDDSSISGHNLTWWQQNHNDWILYACDSNGNPTTDVPRADGFPDVPLAFWNPAVINYQMQLIVPWMAAHGYNTLAVDQVTFYNYLMAPNSLFGEGNTQPGWYGCGSYSGTGGSFVKRYFSGYDKADPAFIADMVAWVQNVHQILTTDPTLSQYHIKLLINHPLPGSSTIDSNEQALVANIDGMVNEDGISNYSRYGVYIPNYVLYMQYAQSHHVAFWDVDYFCTNQPGVTCEPKMTTQQIEYGMAAHQLGNEGGAGLFMSPSTGDIPSYHREYETKLGAPCAEFGTVGTYMYYRRFANGFVVVNNNQTTAQQITLPSGHVYTDIDRGILSSPLTVQPLDGYVMTTPGNGCQ